MSALSRIKREIANEFASMDAAIEAAAATIHPIGGHGGAGSSTRLVVLRNENEARPCTICLEQLVEGANPVLLGFVDLDRAGIGRLIDELADALDGCVILALPRLPS